MVHTDKTSWSLKSVWTFLSEQAHLLLHVVNEDAGTLAPVSDRLQFQARVELSKRVRYGIVQSDGMSDASTLRGGGRKRRKRQRKRQD